MRDAAALLAGYLIGTLLPAYLIGRVRGIDLRLAGDGNLGATNAAENLGRSIGYLTGIVDMLKGPIAVAVGMALGAHDWAAYGAGIAAILGHRYPFYLGFKGGRGFATASGLLIFGLGYSVWIGWLPRFDGSVFLGLFLVLWWVFKDRGVPNALLLPVAYADIALRSPSTGFAVSLGIAVSFVWLFNFGRLRREHLLRLRPETRERLRDIRVALRPAALAFPILYLFVPRAWLLTLVGSVLAFFGLIDISRLLWRRFNLALFKRLAFFYRPNEEHMLTSATLFLLGTYLTILLFPKPVATTALIYVTLGDLAAKYAGTEHGTHPVFTRTLEGSLAFFAMCAAAGFAWSFFVPISPQVYLVGAAAAALTELLPWDLNDNFTVPVMSATAMMLPVLVGAPGF